MSNLNSQSRMVGKTQMPERELTFNEWAKKYRVSSQYTEFTPYFQNNPSCGIRPKLDYQEPTYKVWIGNLVTNVCKLLGL